ncbi:MAG: hypothetical protein HY874_09365 [Chloroflexi bacterium]|nr:hypothetical protein [Chloroflexota bacterium]
MDLKEQIRSWLVEYLSGRIGLEEFRDWFSPNTWDIDECPDLEAQLLAHQIEHRIAEYTSDVWDEDELRDLLRLLIHGDVAASANQTAPSITTAPQSLSTSANCSAAAQVSWIGFGRELTKAG